MSFATPWLLWLLIIPAVLLVVQFARSARRVVLPVDHTTRTRRPILSWILRLSSILPILLLALALIILAGPQVLGPPSEKRQVTNIELVLDVSGSMSAPFPSSTPGATRYTAAMSSIEQFVDKRKGDAAGLTIFGNEVLRWIPLTRDLRVISAATPFVNPRAVPPSLGGTRVAHAVEYAESVLLKQEKGDRMMIVLTDGESPDLAAGKASLLGKRLSASGIVLHAINVGGGTPPRELGDLAAPTGGAVHNATNADALVGVFEAIDKMQPAKSIAGLPEPIAFARPFLIAALVILSLHQLASLGLRSTPW